MERRADRKRYDPLRAKRPGALAGARHGVARARNHNLAAAVHVRGADDFPLSGFLARLCHFVGVEAEHRSHRAGADRHGLLHVAAAAAHDADGVGEIERARCDVGGVLAEAVAGDKGRFDAPGQRGTAAPRC